MSGFKLFKKSKYAPWQLLTIIIVTVRLARTTDVICVSALEIISTMDLITSVNNQLYVAGHVCFLFVSSFVCERDNSKSREP